MGGPIVARHDTERPEDDGIRLSHKCLCRMKIFVATTGEGAPE
jgi:hypothetical protein